MELEPGDQVSGFVVLVDAEGCRHVVRAGGVMGLHDRDPCRDETVVALSGGRQLVLSVPLDRVIGWLGPRR